MKFDREYIRLVCKDLIASVQSGVSSQGWLRWGTNVVVQSIGDNVGIGTVAPTSKLEVAGQIFISSGPGLKFPDATVQASSGVPMTRTISTTAPLTGGGDLSANRTLAVSDFIASGGSAARGTVPTPGATAGTRRYLREDATWQELEGVTDVTVSSAELLALNATPKTLVAAPGAGFALVFVGAVLFYDFITTAYSGIAAGEDFAVKYNNGSGQEVAQIEATGFLDQTADRLRWAYPHAPGTGDSSITPVENVPLVLHMLSGEITTGDGTLKVRTFYRRIPTTL